MGAASKEPTIMTYRDAFRRALATFVAGATASPVASALLDVSAWKAMLAAGIGALLNLAYRTAQAALDQPIDLHLG